MAIKDIIESGEFSEKVEKADNFSVVDFWAPWCGPCKMLAPLIDEISKEYDDVNFVKVNVDDGSDIAAKYNIMSIPTLIFFKNGEIVEENRGLLSKDALKKIIEKYK
ncbi:MAG: thioredoxin [Nanoarchaeota archaeon]